MRDLVAAALPSCEPSEGKVVGGQFHDVVLFPGRGVVRIARRVGSSELSRVVALLERLASAGLPFAIPEPIGPVVAVHGMEAVAMSWIGGAPSPKGTGPPGELARVLAAFADVDVDELADVLAPPHAYAGGPEWYRLMVDEVIPRLPGRQQREARRRVEAAEALDGMEPTLVHGDLAGDNMRWHEGRLVGVLDWDLAAAWDPAVDVACLAWHGWDTVRRSVDASTYRRAIVWAATFGIEQVAAAIAAEEPPEVVDRYVADAVRWLDRTPVPPH